MYLTVGEIAKRLGLNASTLRYYDKEGLLPFVERSESGIRLFKENDMGMLKFYGRTSKEYMQYGLRNVYCISGTLEYGAENYAFQRLGYYYGCYGRSITFP